MGNYATNAQLKARFESDGAVAHLTDTADTGVPDEDVLTEIIEAAESEINSYLAKRYAVPVNETVDTELAAVLKTKTLEYAEVKLLDRGDLVSEAKQRQFDRVVAWCRDVAKGIIVLPAETTPPAATARSPLHSWGTGADASDDSTRLFTRETQAGL